MSASNCYVNICGGIGNQLFQIAAGYAYAKKHNKKLIINTNKWWAGQGTNCLVYKDTIFKNFEFSNNLPENITLINYMGITNYKQLPAVDNSVSLRGYFQSLKYFDEYKDEFISILNLPAVDAQIDIGIHIRRGDYLKHATIHHVCHTKYFEKFLRQYEGRDIKVFTDDPSYVVNEFRNYKFEILHSNSDIKELALMSKCNTVIGSNSSFSWWGALIGGNKSYFPATWFADGREATDIYHDLMVTCQV